MRGRSALNRIATTRMTRGTTRADGIPARRRIYRPPAGSPKAESANRHF